jgi:uncharacterized membrane protein
MFVTRNIQPIFICLRVTAIVVFYIEILQISYSHDHLTSVTLSMPQKYWVIQNGCG